MFSRSFLRATLALGAATTVGLVAACGDGTATGPDLTEVPGDQLSPTTSAATPVEVLVTISGNGGTTGEYATGTAPIFSLVLPDSVVAGRTFTQTVAIDPNNPFGGASVAADYGDGSAPVSVPVTGGQVIDFNTGQVTSSYSFTLNHVYAAPGTYTVRVVGSTSTGERLEIDSFRVTPEPPTIANVNFPATAFTDVSTAFSFDAHGSGTGYYTVKTNWGDGLTTQQTVNVGATRNMTHTWTAPGTYTVSVILSDGTLADTLTRSVQVSDAPPVIANAQFPTTAEAGTPVDFSFDAQGHGNQTLSVDADWGDNQTTHSTVAVGGSRVLTHTWATAGTYQVRVVLADSVQADTVSHAVTVTPGLPVIANLSGPAEAYTGDTVLVSFTASDADLSGTLVWAVSFAGGMSLNSPDVRTDSISSPTLVQVPFVYDTPGDYRILVQVGDLGGGADQVVSDSLHITITENPLSCDPGSYREGNSCVPAPVGTFVPMAGALQPTVCPAGTYQDQTGQIACVDAPAGSYVDITGAAQATLCPAGTFQSATGSTSCDPAPAGSFVDAAGAIQAQLCPAGTFQSTTGSMSCDPAPAGSFVDIAGAVQAQFCPAGTFSASPGQVACEPAPLGSYVALTGQTEATQCAAGYYSDVTGAVACTPAPVGSFVSTAGATQAQLCTAGSFSAVEGSTSCAPAEPGHFVAMAGAAQQTACPAGTYQPAEGQVECIQAPIGSYVDVTGAVQATACPTGTSTLQAGSASASACLRIGEVTVATIDNAVAAGTLVAAARGEDRRDERSRGKARGKGRGGEHQLEEWVRQVKRAVRAFDGRHAQAGCSALRDALAKADGRPSPTDWVAGPARSDVASLLERTIAENGCSTRRERR